MTPLDEALALLRAFKAAHHTAVYTDCTGYPTDRKLERVWAASDQAEGELRALLESVYFERAAAQEGQSGSVSKDKSAEPASVAPSTSTAKYPPDFPATVTKDLMQYSVAAPTPLTDEHTYTVPQRDDLRVVEGLTEVVPADLARDLERKLAEAHRNDERYRYLRQIDRCLDWEILLQCKAGTITGSEQIDTAIDEAMRGKP